MGWSKNYSTLSRHRKIHDLAAVLKCDRFKALGLVVAVHNFAVDFEPDGDLSAYTDESLASQIGWKSRRVGIKSALTRVRLVDDSGVIHDWDEYQGSYHEAKKKNKQRQKAKLALVSRDSPGTVPTRGEERRGEEKRGDVCGSVLTHEAAETWPYPTTSRNGKPSMLKLINEIRGAGNELFADFERHPGREGNAGKSLRALITTLKITPEEFRAVVLYHQGVTIQGGSGYAQTWNDFCEAAQKILNEVRRKPGVSPAAIASAKSLAGWKPKEERT